MREVVIHFDTLVDDIEEVRATNGAMRTIEWLKKKKELFSEDLEAGMSLAVPAELYKSFKDAITRGVGSRMIMDWLNSRKSLRKGLTWMLTYNDHGTEGMDARVSIGKIYEPDNNI